MSTCSRSSTPSAFSALGMICSDTAYTGTTQSFMSSFFTQKYLIQILSAFLYSICRNFSLRRAYFFHAVVPVYLFHSAKVYFDTAYVGTSHCFMSTFSRSSKLLPAFSCRDCFSSGIFLSGLCLLFPWLDRLLWHSIYKNFSVVCVYFFHVSTGSYDIAYIGTSQWFVSTFSMSRQALMT